MVIQGQGIYRYPQPLIQALHDDLANRGGPFWAAADRAKASPAWRYREIATSHMVASNRPTELAGLLLELT